MGYTGGAFEVAYGEFAHRVAAVVPVRFDPPTGSLGGVGVGVLQGVGVGVLLGVGVSGVVSVGVGW